MMRILVTKLYCAQPVQQPQCEASQHQERCVANSRWRDKALQVQSKIAVVHTCTAVDLTEA